MPHRRHQLEGALNIWAAEEVAFEYVKFETDVMWCSTTTDELPSIDKTPHCLADLAAQSIGRREILFRVKGAIKVWHVCRDLRTASN